MMEASSKTQPVRFPIKGENLVNSLSFEMGFEVQPLFLKENLYGKQGCHAQLVNCIPHVTSLPSTRHIVAMVFFVFCFVTVFRKIAVKYLDFKNSQYVMPI